MDFDLSSLLGALRGGQAQQPPQPIQPTPTLQPPQGQIPLSPQAIEDMRRHAHLLQEQSGHHVPLSGKVGAISDAFSGLMGGLEARQAYNALNQRQQSIASELERDPMAPSAPPAPTADTAPGPTSSSAQPANLAYGSGIVPMAAAKEAIAGNESGGRYGEVGPEVPARGGHGAGHAVGKYQVMNYDLPNRLAAAGLPPMNEAEFLRNPEVQERQFEHEFGGLMKKHGNFNDAASVWFSGRPMAQAGNASDAGPGYAGTTVPKYIAHANQTLARLVGGNPSASYGGAPSPTAAPMVNALENNGNAPAISPQQYAQALPGQQSTTTNYPQMVRQQTARLIRAGMDPAQAATMATSMVEGNIKYQPQFSQPDEYGNVMRMVAGQPPQIHVHGSPILESYEPVKGVHQYRLKYRDPTTGVTTMQPATASGEPQGPAVALGQGSGPPAGVARAPLGAPPGATAAPSPTPQPAAPAWPQEAPGSLAGAVAPPGAVVTPPPPQAAPVAPHPGSAVAAPVTPPVATPPADFMTALGTKPPQTASLPPADTPTPAAKSPPLSPISGRPMPQGADATPDKLLEWQRGETAATKRAEAQAGELGKALAKPVEAVIQRGDIASKESRMLDTMEVLHKLTPAQLSGPYSGTFLTLGKALNELSGGAIDLGTAPAEGVEKLSVGLTTLAVREITNRPALAEFKTVMAANPNLSNTVKGRALLIDILRQGAREDVALAKRASQPDVIEHPEMWTEIADQYRAEHPFKVHYDGKEYSTDGKSLAELDDRLRSEAALSGPPGIAPSASAPGIQEGAVVVNRKTGERQQLKNGQWVPMSVPQSK